MEPASSPSPCSCTAVNSTIVSTTAAGQRGDVGENRLMTTARRPRPTGSRRAGARPRETGADAWSTPSPARSRRGSTTRQEILGAARIAFARMGYGGTRIEDIAAEAGTSRTAVYHYFPSKREIFIEIGREATIAFHDVLDTIRAMPE